LLEDGSVRVFSRNQEDNTNKYPDIVSRMPMMKLNDEAVKSAVIDSEAVAWDRENKCILPFQVLSTRKRKVTLLFSYLPNLLYHSDRNLVAFSF
jgi:DNA ligase 1